jgi:hypothetical protein
VAQAFQPGRCQKIFTALGNGIMVGCAHPTWRPQAAL